VVAFHVFFNAIERLPAVVGEYAVESVAKPQNFLRVNFDIRRLSLQPTHPRLVNEDSSMWQRESLLVASGCQQNGGHAGGLADADRRNVVPDELHGVVYRQASGDRSTGAVDIERNIAFGVFSFKEE